MDRLVDELLLLTKAQFSCLESTTQEELELFVDNREKVIEKIQAILEADPQMDRAQFRGRMDEILRMDEVIMSKMQQIQSETRTQIVKVNTAKKQSKAYEPASVSVGGIFFDDNR